MSEGDKTGEQSHLPPEQMSAEEAWRLDNALPSDKVENYNKPVNLDAMSQEEREDFLLEKAYNQHLIELAEYFKDMSYEQFEEYSQIEKNFYVYPYIKGRYTPSPTLIIIPNAPEPIRMRGVNLTDALNNYARDNACYSIGFDDRKLDYSQEKIMSIRQLDMSGLNLTFLTGGWGSILNNLLCVSSLQFLSEELDYLGLDNCKIENLNYYDDLENINFSNSIIKNCKFRQPKMTGIDFSDAIFINCYFCCAEVTNFLAISTRFIECDLLSSKWSVESNKIYGRSDEFPGMDISDYDDVTAFIMCERCDMRGAKIDKKRAKNMRLFTILGWKTASLVNLARNLCVGLVKAVSQNWKGWRELQKQRKEEEKQIEEDKKQQDKSIPSNDN